MYFFTSEVFDAGKHVKIKGETPFLYTDATSRNKMRQNDYLWEDLNEMNRFEVLH